MKPITAFKKTMRFFFHSMPKDSAMAMIYYLFDNLTPTVTTILFARLFSQVYLYLSGSVGVRGMAVNAGMLVGFYLLKELVGFLSSTAINAGVYEKSMHLLKDALVAKSAGLPLACLEDRKVLDMRKRAEECVDNDRLPGIYMLTNMLITSVIGIVSLIVTLSVYHWMLAVTAVISVSQFCISTYLVEKAVYRANAQLTEDKRKRDYVWELYTDPKAVKEMRLMGFGGYLSAKWRVYRDDVNERLWSLEEKGYRYKAVCEGIKTFGYLLGVALALGLMQRGMITVGVFGAALTAFISVQDAIRKLL